MTYKENIEVMEEILDNSSTVPFSSKKLIDCELMRDKLDALRLSLPTIIKEAEETEENREEIIAEANKEADEIRKKADEYVDEAKERAKKLVSETEIIRQAREYAAQVIRDAQNDAEQIIADAKDKDAEIRRILSDNVNKTLADAQEVLKKNLDDVTATMEAVEKLNAPKEETESETE